MRPLTAYIDLKKLIDNYIFLKKKHGGKALAVVKADAYGHGSIQCAKALQPYVDGFAVAFLEEALELRNNGITKLILLLEGVFYEKEYQAVDEYSLATVIQNLQQLKWFFERSWNNQIDVWIKIDSGMRRAGFLPSEYDAVYQKLKAHDKVVNLVDMTHFAAADESQFDFTDYQFQNFMQATQFSQNPKSVCNSAGVLYHPGKYQQISRLGIALYGIDPRSHVMYNKKLKPVMSLQSKVFSVKTLKKGERIGYGGIFTAPYDIKVGLVACGYADGYPRHPSQDNPVLIDGVRSRIIGRISMDMLSVELNRDSQGIGSQVELWGDNISINEIAARADTISYEILCHLKRACKVYCGSLKKPFLY